MKTLVALLMFLSLTLSLTAADTNIRTNIDQDIPLAEAVRWANDQFHPNPPLTEAEVIAAVQSIQFEHPDFDRQLLNSYQRVSHEKVLPKDMYFSQTTTLKMGTREFQVDRINLVLRPPTTYYDIIIDGSGRHEVAGKIMVPNSKTNMAPYVFPIRNRYIASTPPVEQKAATAATPDSSTGSK